MEDSLPASHSIDVPNIKRTELTFIGVEDGYVSLMDLQGNLRTDLKLPDDTDDDRDLSKRINEYAENGKEVVITVLSALGIEKIVECKEA